MQIILIDQPGSNALVHFACNKERIRDLPYKSKRHEIIESFTIIVPEWAGRSK